MTNKSNVREAMDSRMVKKIRPERNTNLRQK